MSTTGAPAADNHVRSGDRLDSEPNDNEMVDQRNTSTDKLLQLARATSDAIIQIPADVLTSLLQSLGGLQSSITILHNTVTDLQSSVIELKKENRDLKQIISSVDKNVRLQMHHGEEFYRFAELPHEIQGMIWRHSANFPQVIAVKRGWKGDKDFLIPVKPHYPQLGVCKEARDEVSKILSRLINGSYTKSPSILFNSSTDTLWLTTLGNNTLQDVKFDDLEYLTLKNAFYGQLPFKKLALPAKYWYEEIYSEYLDLVMASLKRLQTEEVTLIVENDFAHQYADDIAFVQHRGTPDSSLVGMGGFDIFIMPTSWEDAEAAEMKRLRDIQAKRAAERKAYWLTSGIAKEDDVDYEKADLHDFSDWSVKRIRFMEATTVNVLSK